MFIPIMGCGILSKTSGVVTPTKISSEVQKSAWVKKKGASTKRSSVSADVTTNGHATGNGNGNGEEVLAGGSANGERSIEMTAPAAVPLAMTVDGSSVYSKQDSMGLFDLVGRISTDSTHPSSAEATDIGVTTWPDQQNVVAQAEGEPTSIIRRGLGPTPDSTDEGSMVNHKLVELQQLLGPSVFCGPPLTSEVPPPKAKYIVVEGSESNVPEDDEKPVLHKDEEQGGSVSSEASQDSAVDASQFPPDLWDGDLERALTDISKAKAARKAARRAARSAVAQPAPTPMEPLVAKIPCVPLQGKPEYSPLPPVSRKAQLISGPDLFNDLDNHAAKTPETAVTSLLNLVSYLTHPCKNDIEKVRVLFIWIALNMKYDWKYIDKDFSADAILERRRGVCRHYCKLFTHMCTLCDIRAKKLHGFAKGFDFRPGYCFQANEATSHAWSAVFVEGAWRLIDCTWGSGFTDSAGRFQRRLCEHYFLTDPDMFIWTHFPHDDLEINYNRWQLLDTPISLDDFNSRTKVSPYFFDYHLRLPPDSSTVPISFASQTVLRVQSLTFMRVKYKFFPLDGTEGIAYNKWVCSQYRDNRLTVSFNVVPPEPGGYFLKVYARPEEEIEPAEEHKATLNIVCMFYLKCLHALPLRSLRPFPSSDTPLGATQAFFDCGLKFPPNMSGFVVVPSARWIAIFESSQPLVVSMQLFDSKGKHFFQDPDSAAAASKKSYFDFFQEEKEGKSQLRIVVKPPTLGYYKFLIFAIPQPERTAKYKLPLIASFLLDVTSREIFPKLESKNKDEGRKQRALEWYKQAVRAERRQMELVYEFQAKKEKKKDKKDKKDKKEDTKK